MILLKVSILLLCILFILGVFFLIVSPLLLLLERRREKDESRRDLGLYQYAIHKPHPRVISIVLKLRTTLIWLWGMMMVLMLTALVSAIFME